MHIRVMLVLTVILAITITSAQADEPTWLFTVPKAETLYKDYYNIGFVHADLGVTENLELGIHGLKYAIPDSKFALGVSLFPMGSPYVTSTWGTGKSKLHMGIKAAPYIFFAGVEAPIANSVKFIAEFTNGIYAGVRIFPARKWTLDIFAGFVTVEVYRYKYAHIKIEDFYPIPGILFAYSNTL